MNKFSYLIATNNNRINATTSPLPVFLFQDNDRPISINVSSTSRQMSGRYFTLPKDTFKLYYFNTPDINIVYDKNSIDATCDHIDKCPYILNTFQYALEACYVDLPKSGNVFAI